MKINMYTLLGLVKDGKAPKEIIYNGYNYLYHTDRKSYYRSVVGSNWIALTTDFSICTILNEEVEILEEEPRDIEVCGSLFTKSEYDKLAHSEEEKKIPETLEDISEIKCVGCKVEINIAGNKTFFDTDTPIVTEHCIFKINQLIKNQKKIIDYLKSKGE